MKNDAVVIGSGPGGYMCAVYLKKFGKNPVVVERDLVGGVCTNRGCIPTKALAATSKYKTQLQKMADHGIEFSEQDFDPEKAFKRRDRISKIMRKGVEKLLKDNEIEVISAEAEVLDANKVKAADKVIECEHIVVATGTSPTGVGDIKIDEEWVLSGDRFANLHEIPGALVVIGGGFIGCEYASIYSDLGSNVTLIEAQESLLPNEDPDVSEELEKLMSKKMRVLTSTRATKLEKETQTVWVGEEKIHADKVLLAVGRKPNIPEGLRELGLKYGAKGIETDSQMKTNIPNIYAIGDVTTNYQLAHTAYEGAKVAAMSIAGKKAQTDFNHVPWCVFTEPEIARIGKIEEGEDAVSGVASYASNGKARCMGEPHGFCKVVAERQSKKIKGVHMMGEGASSLIGEAILAVKYGLSLDEVVDTIHPHPTLTEVFKKACEDALDKIQ